MFITLLAINESFLAYTHTSFNQDKWEFIPISFKEFLQMLSKTKINENNEYNITNLTSHNHEEASSFESLIQTFACQMYRFKSPSEKKLREFYINSYQIKNNTLLDDSLLNKTSKELGEE